MRTSTVIILLYVLPLQVLTQSTDYSKKYSDKKLRLLIQTGGLFLHAANQGSIDLDSAMVLSCAAQNIRASLSYDEGYSDGSDLPATMTNLPRNKQELNSVLYKLTRTGRMSILLQLCGFYLFKPGAEKADLVPAKYYIEQAISLSDSLGISKWKCQSQVLLGKYYFQAGDVQKSRDCLLKVVAVAKQSGNKLETAYALEHAGTYLPTGDSLKGNLLNEAMLAYKNLGEHEKEIETLMKLLGIHFREGNLALAKQELQMSLQLQKACGFEHLHYTQTTLSYISEINGNLAEGLSYALESVKTMEATGDTFYTDHLYSRLGSIYRGSGQHDKALALYDKLMNKLGTKNSNSWYKNFLATIIALVGLHRYNDALDFIERLKKEFPPQNAFDEMHLDLQAGICLATLGKNDLAEKHYLRMIELAEEISSKETSQDVVHCYTKIGLFYANSGNISRAKFFMKKATSMSSGKIFLYTRMDIEQALFKIDSFDGNFTSSIRHLQEYQKLSDTILNIEKNKQIGELEIKYETDKKEADIKILEKTSVLQQTELLKGKQVRNLILAGIVLLVALMSLLYNRYRLKQKTNMQLENLIGEKEMLLEEKDWLVKEIHHRVKNNLQIVMSLMNIQSTYLESGVAFEAIRESQSRMNAMSLIHQKLYQSTSLISIDLQSYITELISYLKESFVANQRIKFDIDVTPVELDVTQAVPIGLILNEAVTNSIKYAFPTNNDGTIAISLKSIGEEIVLSISDNGIGLPATFNVEKSNSIGMTLMQTLSDQLDGSLVLKSEYGVQILITFRKEKAIVRHQKINNLV